MRQGPSFDRSFDCSSFGYIQRPHPQRPKAVSGEQTLRAALANHGQDTQGFPVVKGILTARRLAELAPGRCTFLFLGFTYAEAMHSLLLPFSRLLGEEVNTMLFRSGHISDDDVFLANDVVTVTNEQVIITKQSVRGLSAFAATAKELKLGWGMLADCEVIYFYDTGDRNFGYGVNLQYPSCSEWGYAPFSSVSLPDVWKQASGHEPDSGQKVR